MGTPPFSISGGKRPQMEKVFKAFHAKLYNAARRP
jgi:hypothetical protein